MTEGKTYTVNGVEYQSRPFVMGLADEVLEWMEERKIPIDGGMSPIIRKALIDGSMFKIILGKEITLEDFKQWPVAEALDILLDFFMRDLEVWARITDKLARVQVVFGINLSPSGKSETSSVD